MKRHLDRIVAMVILVVTAITSWAILTSRTMTNGTSLKLDGIDLRVGEVYKLEVAENSKYESENPEIAEIDSNGLLIAKGVGTTTIKIKTNEEEKVYTVEVLEVVENSKDIKNAVITNVTTQNYTGLPIAPEVEVAINGKQLQRDIDYLIEYANNTNIGTATISISGKGDYTGNKSITFKIEQLEATKAEAQITCVNPEYNGLEQEIATCTGGTIKGNNKTDVGEYKVTCTGDNLHYDAKDTMCKITKASIENAVISDIAEQKYTGNIVEPKVGIMTETDTLIEESDYSVEYKNNIKEGTAEAIITGKDNYTGTKTISFDIDDSAEKPKAIITCSNNKIYNGSKQTIAVCSGGTIKNAEQTKVGKYEVTCTGDSTHKDADKKTCSIASGNIGNAIASTIKSQTYTGKQIKPAVTLTLNGKKLENNKDYTLSYKNNINAGTAEIVVTGKGNYEGSSKVVKFTINAPAIKKTPAVITCKNNIYNGQNQTIATCSGGTISNASQMNAGTYNVSCVGDSTHTGVNKSCAILRADLSKSQITAIADQVYSNKAVTPSVTVLYSNKKLVSTDYTVKYSNNNALGTATITVTGKGNYTGTKTTTFKIVKDKTPAVITCANKEYNGQNQTIATCSGGTVKNATQSKVGNYNISCTGDSGHKDAVVKSCSITKKNIANATVPAIANQAYTGSPITPQVTVKFGTSVVAKTDYTVTYTNNTNEGIATVIITGKGNYTGTKKVTFKILKRATITCANKVYNRLPQTIATCSGGTVNNARQTKVGNYSITCTPDANHTAATTKSCSVTQMDINGVTISAVAKQKYTGKAITPTVSLSQDRKGLVKDTDYTMTYKNNINKGTASIVLTGKGNYKGTKTVNFVIADSATITCSNKIYNGSAQTIATCTGGTINGASQIDVGTYTVSCKGDSTHTDVSTKCAISQLDVSKTMALSLSSTEFKYTGKEIKPTVTVKNSNKTLVNGTDYTVSYKNNVNKGTATVTVTAKGNYKGSKTINFKIVDSLSTAVESVSLNTTSLSLKSNASSTLTATIKPSTAVNKGVTWTSSNPIIARVDANGKVTAVKPGTATITVTTSDGKKTATAKVTVTSNGGSTLASYNSSTLSYWVEQPSGKYYMITHIWVSDPYNQIKTAITSESKAGRKYPRNIQVATTIMENEINNKGYSNKGLVAVNGSAMISSKFNTDLPPTWIGTSCIALVVNNGTVIRNSSNMTTEEKKYAAAGYIMNYVDFIDKDGNLRYEKYCNPKLASCSITENNNKTSKILNTYKAKYTFGFRPILVEDGKRSSKLWNYSTNKVQEDSWGKKNIRNALCQIDTNNFILITSKIDAKSDDYNMRAKQGVSLVEVADIMINLGCKMGVNLDGGGSANFRYKTNTSEIKTIKAHYDDNVRGLSDMLYFVEK